MPGNGFQGFPRVAKTVLSDATTTTPGVVEVDAVPGSGHPVALTVPRLGAALGVAPLGGDITIPSAYLPVTVGTTAEAGRWTVNNSTPLLAASQTWEGNGVLEPTVIFGEQGVILSGVVWKMWYTGNLSAVTNAAMGYAECLATADPTNAANWTKYTSNPVLGQGAGGVAGQAIQSNVIKVGSQYRCFYSQGASLLYKVSTDGITWSGGGTALAATGTYTYIANTAIWLEGLSSWHMIVDTFNGSLYQLQHATSTDGLSWTLDAFGPLTTLQIAAGGMYGSPGMPAPVKMNGYYQLYYHAAIGSGNLLTDIYRAESTDLHTWTQISGPIISRTGTPAGTDQVADANVLEVNGTSYLFYDIDDNTAHTASIMLAVFPGTLHQLVSGAALPSFGSVTSVGLSVPADLNVSGSPITSTGTFAVTRAAQSGNKGLLSPANGSSGTPTYRALVVSDLPVISIEILVEDDTSAPPVQLTNEAQDDFLFSG